MKIKFNPETGKLAIFVDLKREGKKAQSGKSFVVDRHKGGPFQELSEIDDALEGFKVSCMVIRTLKTKPISLDDEEEDEKPKKSAKRKKKARD